MIYGINFNGVQIPDTMARLFPREMKIYRCANCGQEITRRKIQIGKTEACPRCNLAHLAWNAVRGNRSRLVGIGQSEEEKQAMWIQASNGSRQLHVEPRQTAGGIWYGFYTF